MPNALDRYVAVTYFKYYALSILVLALPMYPLLARFSLSYEYVPAMLSLAGAATACATMFELRFRRELATLQRYGVAYAEVLRPLLYSTMAPIVMASAAAVVLAANRGTAVCCSVLGACCAIVCVRVACKRSWDAASGRSGIRR